MDGEYDFRDLLEAYLQQAERDVSWLARQLGKAPSTVSRWYHRETRPQNPVVVIQMAEALKVPTEEQGAFFAAAALYYGWSRSVFAFTLSPMQTTTSRGTDLLVPQAEMESATPLLMETAEKIEVRLEVRGWWWNQTDRFFRGKVAGDADEAPPSHLEGMLWQELGQMKDHILYGPAMILTTLLLIAMRGGKRQQLVTTTQDKEKSA